jgi:hypothetical protein
VIQTTILDEIFTVVVDWCAVVELILEDTIK